MFNRKVCTSKRNVCHYIFLILGSVLLKTKHLQTVRLQKLSNMR